MRTAQSAGATTRELQDAIERAIVDSLPKELGRRNRQVFELCRALKAIPALADAPPDVLRPWVQRWHQLALPVIGTQPFEESWVDFLRGWSRVRFPQGSDPMAIFVERAKSSPLPEEAARFESTDVQMLVALCVELQRAAGDGPFFLSCRTAGRLLGIDHTTASRWLYLLVQEKILAEIEKGSQRTRRASRYRYLPPL